jgi:hypothetical protein
METKTCRKCDTAYDITMFQLYGYMCKYCARKVSAKWRSENKLRHCNYSRAWYEAHKEYATARQKEYAKSHPDIRKKCMDNYRSTARGKVCHNISSLMRKSLKNKKGGLSWEALVGYNVYDLINHLESLFTNDMSWDNYGMYWQIDHIIPVTAFNFETPNDIDFKRCWAIDNLQPLPKHDNLSKQGKVSKPFQPSLLVVCN